MMLSAAIVLESYGSGVGGGRRAAALSFISAASRHENTMLEPRCSLAFDEVHAPESDRGVTSDLPAALYICLPAEHVATVATWRLQHWSWTHGWRRSAAHALWAILW